MRGVYIGDGRVLVSPVWGGKLLVPAGDLSLAPSLIIDGAFELPLTKYLLKLVKPGAVVFDVGANLGYFTVLLGFLAGPAGLVVAYEPNPDLHPILLDNLAINFHHLQTTLIKKAAHAKAETLTFHVAERFSGLSSLKERSPKGMRHNVDRVRALTVEAEPLDIHLAHLNHIDLVKIDTEGGEFQVLSGMRQMLERKVVDVIVFEWNRVMLGDDAEPLLALLADLRDRLGMDFFKLAEDGGLIPFSIEEARKEEFIENIVAKRA